MLEYKAEGCPREVLQRASDSAGLLRALTLQPENDERSQRWSGLPQALARHPNLVLLLADSLSAHTMRVPTNGPINPQQHRPRNCCGNAGPEIHLLNVCCTARRKAISQYRSQQLLSSCLPPSRTDIRTVFTAYRRVPRLLVSTQKVATCKSSPAQVGDADLLQAPRGSWSALQSGHEHLAIKYICTKVMSRNTRSP
jgi:hypothetical protein